MGKGGALKAVVVQVQREISRVHGSNSVTIIDVQNLLRAKHGNDCYRLARFWREYGSAFTGCWTDFGDALRVNAEFSM
jgi:hypothetical protein